MQILTKSVVFENVPLHTSQTKFADIRFNNDAILQFTSNSPLFQFSTNPLSGSGGQTRNVGIIITKNAPVGNHTAKIAVAKKLLQTTTLLPIGFIDVTATVVVNQTDLTVTLQPSPNVISGNPSEIEFVFRVLNSGDLSKACEMQIELDGKVEKTVSIPAIPANAGGSPTEIFLPVNQPGQHQVKLRVDSNNLNQESNETNNELVFTMNVP